MQNHRTFTSYSYGDLPTDYSNNSREELSQTLMNSIPSAYQLQSTHSIDLIKEETKKILKSRIDEAIKFANEYMINLETRFRALWEKLETKIVGKNGVVAKFRTLKDCLFDLELAVVYSSDCLNSILAIRTINGLSHDHRMIADRLITKLSENLISINEILDQATLFNSQELISFHKKTLALQQEQLELNGSRIREILERTLDAIANLNGSCDKQSVFLSYAWPIEQLESLENWIKPFLKHLHSHLAMAGFSPILDILDNLAGANLHAFVEKASTSSYTLIFCSPSLYAKLKTPQWRMIQYEISYANRKHDIETNIGLIRVIPILLCGTPGNSYPIQFNQFSTVRDWTKSGYIEGLKNLISHMFYQKWPIPQEYKNLWEEFEIKYTEAKSQIYSNSLSPPNSPKISPKFFRQYPEQNVAPSPPGQTSSAGTIDWYHLQGLIANYNTKLLDEFLQSYPDTLDYQDPHHKGRFTMLHYAIKIGSLDHVKVLLSRGAKYDIKNADGVSAIDLALDDQYSNSNITNALMQNLIGKYPHLNINKHNLDELATKCIHDNDSDGLKLVLNVSDDVIRKLGSKSGQSLLHIAVALKNLPCVKILLESGADHNLQDSQGKSPLDYAADDHELSTLFKGPSIQSFVPQF